jgi:O-6-methylguanine DNA methyltransferase
MKPQFKNILEIIDMVAGNHSATDTLFQAADNVKAEDKIDLEAWSGKSISQIKEIISPSYGKRQIVFNPFMDVHSSMHSPLLFSKFDVNTNPAISYSFENTDFGKIVIASTSEGICYLVFYSGEESKMNEILQKEFPGSVTSERRDEQQEAALNYLNGNATKAIHLHVKGTDDQLQIWEALTRVPSGKLISYGTLAKATNHMAQDIGVAMGDNRIAMLIPCHRVIKATGDLGQYHWGAKRKQAMIIKEASLL